MNEMHLRPQTAFAMCYDGIGLDKSAQLATFFHPATKEVHARSIFSGTSGVGHGCICCEWGMEETLPANLYSFR